MSDKKSFLDWYKIITKSEQKNKFKDRINVIGKSTKGKPSNFQLILKGEFKDFKHTVEEIIDTFLNFKDENIKNQKIQDAILDNAFNSNPYTLEVAETIAILILEYADQGSLPIHCEIKKDNNFIQM